MSETTLTKLTKAISNPLAAPSKGTELSYKDAQALGQWVHEKYEAAKSERSQVQVNWGINMNMFRGNQSFQWNPGSRRFMNPPQAPWKVRHTVNKIRPMIRTEIARLTSQKPSAVIVPASSEDKDLFAAQAGEQAWEYLYTRKKLTAIHRNMTFWRQLCGTAFIKTWWDQNKVVDGAQGDICFGHVTPFHLYVPDLREIEIEDQPYIINVYTRPLENIKMMFGGKLRDNLVPSTASTNDIISDSYLDTSTTDRKADSCMIYEVWLKPGAHPMFPQGGMITLVDQQVVQFETSGLPYQHGQYPFTKFDHIPSGKFYSDSSITDVIPLQKEYNRTRSQIIEAKNRTAKPKFLYQKGSLDPTKINTEAGQFIEYKMGFERPTALPPIELPSYIFNDLQSVVADFEDLSGQHQVSKGSAPPGVTAATAINYLQERDDSYLTHTYQSDEEGWQKLGGQALSMMVQFWDVPRLVKVTGTDGAFDAVQLKGSDIANGTDIRIEGGSSMPTSKAAKQAFLMDLMKMGFIPPDKGLEMMDMGGMQKLYDNLKIDERQAQRENLRMRELQDADIEAAGLVAAQQAGMAPPMGGDPAAMGVPGIPGGQPGLSDPNAVDVNSGMPLEQTAMIPVNNWDNHALHIEIHNRFRKGQTFETLSEAVRGQFDLHVRHHQAMLVQQQMGTMGGGDPAAGDPNSIPVPEGPAPQSGGGENQFTSISPEGQG